MWRRFFAAEKEEEEEREEAITEIIDEVFFDSREIEPVATSEAVQARAEFSKEAFRNLTRKSSEPTSTRIIEQPNLQIPVGDDHVCLAQ